MERDKELAKLVNVLRRTSRMALQSEWTGSSDDAARFCVEQYNRVLTRLKELDAGVGAVFEPLAPDSSLTVAAMACRQLAAYYEDEVGNPGRWGDWKGVWTGPADKQAFKDFWSKSARDIEDLGEYIRENVDEWINQRKGRAKQEESRERTTAPIDPDKTNPQ